MAHPPTGGAGFVITDGTKAKGNGFRLVSLEHGPLLKRCPHEDFYCFQPPIAVNVDAFFGVWIYQDGN